MSPRRKSGKGNQPRKQKQRGPDPVEFWRSPVEPETDDVVVPAPDPTAVLRSLGDPPLTGQGAAGGHYLAAVAERAAVLATALAASAGILVEPEDEHDADLT